MGDISYTFSEYSFLNSTNGILTIEADEYELYLTPVLSGCLMNGASDGGGEVNSFESVG